MVRRTRLLLLLAGLLSACSIAKQYPGRGALIEAGRLSEDDMERLLARQIELTQATRAVVLWLEQDQGRADSKIPEAERGALLSEFVDDLTPAPFANASFIPTAMGLSNIDSALVTEELRALAVRFRGDVLVLLTSRANTYAESNVLAIAYLALFPMFVVPGTDLEAFATVEACVLDVRSGLFIGCAQHRGRASDSFVPYVESGRRLRELSVEATRDALAQLPRQLRVIIEAADESPVPRGLSYRTERGASFEDEDGGRVRGRVR